jgi:hypothetical protein
MNNQQSIKCIDGQYAYIEYEQPLLIPIIIHIQILKQTPYNFPYQNECMEIIYIEFK